MNCCLAPVKALLEYWVIEDQQYLGMMLGRKGLNGCVQMFDYHVLFIV